MSVRHVNPTCKGLWVPMGSKPAVPLVSPSDPEKGSSTLFCLCYWGCQDCEGTMDLFNDSPPDILSPNRPTTWGAPLGNGGCACPGPGPQIGCPQPPSYPEYRNGGGSQ
jgi:hypothetical protein